MGTFNMPSLGADMEAGTLVEWLKHAGDIVHRGDIVAVVETHKGAIEIEIFEDGTIAELLVSEGEKVPVGMPLARIAGTLQAPLEHAAPPGVNVAPPRSPRPNPVIAGPVAGRASPVARRLAAEHGIELSAIIGSGPGGAIVHADVERAIAAQPPARQRPGLDLGQMRLAIAAAMTRSKRDIPHYYLTHSIDASVCTKAVEDYNAARAPAERILLGALLLKAVALSMREFPEFNGFCQEEAFHPSKGIHVGVAVSIRGGGLAAPAIHDTDQLPVGELMAKMRDLIARVRRGSFRSSELTDATVTVSSLGERGVESLLPIIYPPQVAIIGFGTVQQRAWVVDDQVAPRPVLSVTLAADHRVSDGHRGALLLRRIEELLGEADRL
ncbi:MAG TPA: dihydrolipoamide acetyltransferase family protein [Sphingomicrobium sp.]|nr:dihydrolipoamide acetyltransferase family protein [Sphingomicrobium sp.]